MELSYTVWDLEDTAKKTKINDIPNVFVKELPLEMQNVDFYKLASRFGNVLACKLVPRSIKKLKSTSSGLILYETFKEAYFALNEFPKYNYSTRVAKDSLNTQLMQLSDGMNKNVYFANLPCGFNEEEFLKLIDPIKPLRFKIVEKDMNKPCAALASFFSREQAMQMISKFDGFIIEKRKVQVRFADNNKQKDFKKTNKDI